MGVPDNLKKHLGKIEAAFKKDGFFVHSSCSKDGREQERKAGLAGRRSEWEHQPLRSHRADAEEPFRVLWG